MWARSALRLTNARQRPPKIARTRLKVLYPRKLTSPVAKTWKNNGIRWNNRAQTHGIEGARVGFALLRCVGSEEAPHRLVADDDKADIWIDLAREPAHRVHDCGAWAATGMASTLGSPPLGSKRTFGDVRGVSALPLIADITS